MESHVKDRIVRRLDELPDERGYQILDYIEFLESKYSPDLSAEASGLQSFAEKLEDQLRKRTVSPASLREAFQLISAADRVLSNVANVGRELLGDLNGSSEGKGGKGKEKVARASKGGGDAGHDERAGDGPTGGGAPPE